MTFDDDNSWSYLIGLGEPMGDLGGMGGALRGILGDSLGDILC